MNGPHTLHHRLLLCLPLVALPAVACTTVTHSEDMVPQEFDIRFVRPRIVEIVAHGSQGTFPIGKSVITDKTLYEAVYAAIEASGVFVGIAHDEPGESRLEVSILDLDSSQYSVVMSSDLKVQWTLTDLETGETLWRETIATSSRADSLIEEEFENRHRYTIEDAAKKNIRQAISFISRIDELH